MKSSLGAVSILACVLFGCATADPLEPRVCEHVLNVEIGPESRIRTIFLGWRTK